MSPLFDPGLLLRVEEAGINASAPPQQLWIDGWLVRFSPGQAKRARCVQAVAAGSSSVEERWQRCLSLYAAHGLRPYVRLTPFSQPAGLDRQLEAMGLERIDDTRVMVAALPLAAPPAETPAGARIETADARAFAEWIGAARGSSPAQCRAHADRLLHSPVPYRAVLVVDPQGRIVAGGQVAREDDLAGLYDIFTHAEARQRGWAEIVCRWLLALAVAEGARVAYLQVDAGNEAARRVYHRLGFQDAYAYHYRTPPAS